MTTTTISQAISDSFETDPASVWAQNRASTTSDNSNARQEHLTNPPLENTAVSLERGLYTWPSSVFGLTSGSLLLVAGAVSDLLGARYVELFGILLLGVTTIACGLSTTGAQLIVFRALAGVALAAHLPASVSLVSATLPSGKVRNIGFACLGLSQPLGFAAGLVLGGILIERVGWAIGFYLAGGPVLGIALAGYWTLPKPPNDQIRGMGATAILRKLYTDIDWVGAGLASFGLALLSYVLAFLSADVKSIASPPAFPLWMHYREKKGKSALIPNSLWKKLPFTTICVMLALTYGQLNSMELYSSLYFQEVQSTSTLITSLYLLPNLTAGTLINLTMGLVVHRISARSLVAGTCMLCAIGSLLMAIVNPNWSYWYLQFWAQILAPLGGDVLFTVGMLVVSDSFPEKTQSLAGAVFNTAAQLGLTLGVGICQLVSLSVEEQSGSGENAILKGYRASFWTQTAYMLTCVVLAVTGLRRIGTLGLKRE
ncbi:MFS general substrate transporter [Xylariaceae sp. FL1272]|nr:MFS general substrate transporter [Xylariaceae sp. FL1272]